MKKGILYVALAAICGAGCLSCEKEKDKEKSDSGEKGYVTGQVINTQGQPVSGAQVYISSDVFFNPGVQTTSDATGNYKISKPEPQGPWIDGSAGQTLTVHSGPPHYSYIYDIPVGRYKVSATYAGKALQVRDNSQGSSDDFGYSTILDFLMEGSTTNGGPMRMYLEFSK